VILWKLTKGAIGAQVSTPTRPDASVITADHTANNFDSPFELGGIY
jgi:hypothetical protein